jgi:exosortase H (IPTLxxWG-CTERM-specific)
MGKDSRKKKERRELREQQAAQATEEEKPKPTRKKNRPLRRFVILYVVLLGLFQIAYYDWITQSSFFASYLAYSGKVAAAFLNLFGLEVSTFKDTLTINQFSISIKLGCDGLRAMAVLVLGVLAFPTGGKRKIIGTGAGLALLLVLNILRIATLLIVGQHSNKWFHLLHDHIWPVFLISCSLLLFVAWMLWVTTPPKPAATSDETP